MGGAERPFFVWCSFRKPHSPCDPPEPYERLYDPHTFPPPIGGAEDLEGKSPAYVEARRVRLLESLSPQAIQRARARYAGDVRLIDRMVGELRATLDALGVAGRTAICFTADHGDLLGDHGLFFKSLFYRGAWHVPLLLYAPGRLESVGVAERFATTQDIYPTLLHLAGVEPPAGVRLHGEALDLDPHGGPDVISGSIGRGAREVLCARSKRWSYVVFPHGAYEELYDLAADPGERHNLIDPAGHRQESSEVVATVRRLRERLEAWLADVGDTAALDDRGRLRLDASQRGWQPRPAPETGLGLRPY